MKEQPLIIVTGAAGFIGSCCVRELNDRGFHNLLLVDDIKRTEKWKNLVGKRFCDLISRHTLFAWLQNHGERVHAILHLGACSDTLESDGDFLMENNYRYSVRLAQFALERGVRFVYASSAATYGNGSLGFSDDHGQLEHFCPLNLYGYSKYAFDLWVKAHDVLDKVVGLKYFNVFGPNEAHKGRMASMIWKMAPLVQQEGVIRLFRSNDPERFKDGEQVRDFIYVKDAARMTCDFLNNSMTGIYNIGSGEAMSWNQVAESLFEALGKPTRIEYIDMPPTLAGQYQNYTRADMNKYKRTHGVASQQSPCTYSLREGVRDCVQYLFKGAFL